MVILPMIVVYSVLEIPHVNLMYTTPEVDTQG